MKVLIDHPWPFTLAHGGFAIQILETIRGLRAAGVEVETLRWWDEGQTGDLLHVFGEVPGTYLQLASQKGWPVVMTVLFTAQCNRSPSRLKIQGSLVRLIGRLPKGRKLASRLGWSAYSRPDRVIVGLEAERDVLEKVYGLPRSRSAILPLGTGQAFLDLPLPTDRPAGDHLVTHGTITERKGCLEMARLARQARVPILFIGKPYSFEDPYWKAFEALVDQSVVRWQAHTDTPEALVQCLDEARGFVLNSDRENWCLSAHEADARGLPLLLPDQRWSRERFGSTASFWKGASSEKAGTLLQAFFQSARPRRGPSIPHANWEDVGRTCARIYREVLDARSSRTDR